MRLSLSARRVLREGERESASLCGVAVAVAVVEVESRGRSGAEEASVARQAQARDGRCNPTSIFVDSLGASQTSILHGTHS